MDTAEHKPATYDPFDAVARGKHRNAELGILWQERHKRFCVKMIAEMRKLPDATEQVMKEFAIEWNLETNTQAGRARVELIQRIIYDRLRYYMYDPRAKKMQEAILEMRGEWRTQINQSSRLSNKAARIQELEHVYREALKDKQFNACVNAIRSIAEEVGDLKTIVQLSQQNNLMFFESLTDAQKVDTLQKSLQHMGINSGTDGRIAKLLVEGRNSASDSVSEEAH